ncbi:MAG: DUF3793 family protein [Lachnospiraceae bacterium]|nr:DUF3793 family protein [Lachnospiraceae bacterium]
MERLEKYLVQYCAPTLACLKTANLFSCPESMLPALYESLAGWNICMRGKGIKLCLLKEEGNALVYVYRVGKLESDLMQPAAFRILKGCGYETAKEEGAICTLKERLKKSGEFPHEIGLFLGYPPGDVRGFIRYGGRCFKCTGCWKVYGDEEAARRVFARFERCRRAYMRLWQAGESIMQLTVAATEDTKDFD